jgi:hypothetical protein
MAVKKAHRLAPDLSAIAHAAGLGKAVKQFPDDVAAAVQSAAQARSALHAQENIAAEPWPPMRVRIST